MAYLLHRQRSDDDDPHTPMTETAAPQPGVPPGIEKILRRFTTLTPDMTRQALVQYSNRLPPLPERFRGLDAAQHRVHECQTPVAIYPEVVDGKMYYHADVPQGAPTIRALLSLLFGALNGEPPETTLAIPPDFVRQVMGKIGLETREVGLNAMVERLKRAARQAAAERGAGAA
jgi:cysteine desulfuration protein SufE